MKILKKILDKVLYVLIFAAGILFYAKFLDKPEVINKIKRLKQKKGADNIMTVSVEEKPVSDKKKARMAKKQKRKQKRNMKKKK